MGPADRFRAGLRSGAEAVFQIGRDRQIGCADNGAGIFQDLLAAEAGIGIAQADGEGKTGAGRRQSPKTDRRQNSRRPGIPRIGHDKGFACMQFVKPFHLLGMIHHKIRLSRPG
jgi:hypothetical protein